MKPAPARLGRRRRQGIPPARRSLEPSPKVTHRLQPAFTVHSQTIQNRRKTAWDRSRGYTRQPRSRRNPLPPTPRRHRLQRWDAADGAKTSLKLDWASLEGFLRHPPSVAGKERVHACLCPSQANRSVDAWNQSRNKTTGCVQSPLWDPSRPFMPTCMVAFGGEKWVSMI